MTREDVIDLLAFARVYDARVTVGKAETAAWFLALQRYRAAPAQEAIVAHYQASTEKVMPANIISHIRTRQIAARDQRLALPAAAPADPEHVARCRAQVAAAVDAAAARFALSDADPGEVPRWRPGMDKRELALRQAEASRRRRDAGAAV